jgi:hypothetical protein
MVPHSRVSAVCTNHEVEANLNLRRPIRVCVDLVFDLEPGFARAEVCTSELVVEEDVDVGKRIQDVQETAIQTGPVNGKYGLGRAVSARRSDFSKVRCYSYPAFDIIVLGLFIQPSQGISTMNHTAPHGYSSSHDMVHK